MCSPELPGTLSPDAVLAAVDAVKTEKVDAVGAKVVTREENKVELELKLVVREMEVLKEAEELREAGKLKEADELRETGELFELPATEEVEELRGAEGLDEADLTVERVDPSELTVTVCVTVVAEQAVLC